MKEYICISEGERGRKGQREKEGGGGGKTCLCQLMRSPLRTETLSLDKNNIG